MSDNLNINWYPGHMAKTKKQLIEDLKLIDIVVEVVDARIPLASINPDIQEYIKDKTKIVVLNKADLADENETKNWVKKYNSQGITAVEVEASNGKNIQAVINKIKEEYEKIKEKYILKGRIGKAIRVMVIGIPNVGKSTFINSLAKRNTAKVGNKPGVTKQKQWIKIDNNIEIMDTPGMLWPRLDNQEYAMHLAFCGTIGENSIDNEEIAYYLLEYLIKNYPNRIEERYNIKIENKETMEILEEIARKRGAIVSGGNINMQKISDIILNDKLIIKNEKEINMMSPLTWAYVGDSVYELYIRTYLANNTNLNPHKMHVQSIKYVKAGAQAKILKELNLDDEEKDIVRRGRNAQNHHLPKNASIEEYSYSTGFEALIGFLYLNKRDERLSEILEECIRIVSNELTSR